MEKDLEGIMKVLGFADENQGSPGVAQMFAQMAIARAMVALCDRLDKMTVPDCINEGNRILVVADANE